MDVPADHPNTPKLPPREGPGRPRTDYDAMMPELLDALASGLPVRRACRELGYPSNGDLWRTITSERWRDEYANARRAGAAARIDHHQDKLESLAERIGSGEKIPREAIDAARWAANHAQWTAERSDPDSWGREDRLKTTSVSAIRIVLETPPQAAQLPPAEYVQELPAPIRETPRLGTGGGEA